MKLIYLTVEGLWLVFWDSQKMQAICEGFSVLILKKEGPKSLIQSHNLQILYSGEK